MLSRRAKSIYYLFAAPLMTVNGFLYRHFRAPRDGAVRVHLGPGQNNYLDGWINVDANMFTARCDLWADLRNPLPFHDSSLDAVYSHHVIEHLPSLSRHLKEIHRCMKPGGMLRVGGPNGDSAIAKFLANDADWFGDFPDKRASIGGRFENFIFCRQEHLTILTRSFMAELLTGAGFIQIAECLPVRQTTAPHLFKDCLLKEAENDFDWPHTLIFECAKRKDFFA